MQHVYLCMLIQLYWLVSWVLKVHYLIGPSLDLCVYVSITCVDVAKQVLNRCVASTPEKVELDYSFVEDHGNEDARWLNFFIIAWSHDICARTSMACDTKLNMVQRLALQIWCRNNKWTTFSLWIHLPKKSPTVQSCTSAVTLASLG